MSKKNKNINEVAEYYSRWGADDVKLNASIIEETLEAFGLKVRVMEINAFRIHVQYCIEIEIGTTIEEILKREADLALALGSLTGKIKIIAPVPNTHYIGINLPKRKTPLGSEKVISIVTANDKIVKIRDLNLLVKKFPKKRLSVLIDDALNFTYRYKFDVVGVILFQKELKIKPKEAIVLFKELFNMGVITNPRSEEGKSGVLIGDVDWTSLKKYNIN
jgi:DNA segregation ATPase FtsK/SpoIIIE-like protein